MSTRSRKYLLTINNPLEKGYTREKIKHTLETYKSMIYWACVDEIGEQGTAHTHIYFTLKNATRWDAEKERWPQARIDGAKGTSEQNRAYLRKEGKHKDKAETCLLETFEESGECPVEVKGQRNDLSILYEMIAEGLTNYEIIQESPQYMFAIDRIEKARQTIKEEQQKDKFRNLTVTYLYGDSGSGKTRLVMEQHGYGNVYRVTDYNNPFDGYKGQDIICFEEFRSSIKISDMLNYLDGYPLELPCRYSNKIACFTQVYIISNISLKRQYTTVQAESPETWKAFTRRISMVYKLSHNEEWIKPTEHYLSVIDINDRRQAL